MHHIYVQHSPASPRGGGYDRGGIRARACTPLPQLVQVYMPSGLPPCVVALCSSTVLHRNEHLHQSLCQQLSVMYRVMYRVYETGFCTTGTIHCQQGSQQREWWRNILIQRHPAGGPHNLPGQHRSWGYGHRGCSDAFQRWRSGCAAYHAGQREAVCAAELSYNH